MTRTSSPLPDTAPGDVFARVAGKGRAAVLTGSHRVEAPPAEGGRWGPSVVFLVGDAAADALDGVTRETLAACGQGTHWPSGSDGYAHVTVRALEPYPRAVVAAERVDRYAAALTRAMQNLGEVVLAFDGMVVSPAGVLATATSRDGVADELRSRLAAELGPDGWLENDHVRRDPIWYCTLVHFAGPLADARRLVDWVDARRRLRVADATFGSASVCRWDFDGVAMAPTPLAEVAR
ncbi:MAG TPA: hypothetical protein VF230_03005 [Acidimicrobiales bacterium]